MEIQILPQSNSNTGFDPVIKEKTEELISRFRSKLDDGELNNLLSETKHILSHCTNPQKLEEQDTTHLTVGYVQSGKTMSFTTLSALAADNGYRIIIYFAGSKTNLLNQTTKRLRKDLLNNGANNRLYKIYENPDIDKIFELRNKLRIGSKPAILITVLKHYLHINSLANIFKNKTIQTELGKQAVMIIDDEADQASLNGFAYINSKKATMSSEWDEETESKESSTYSSILNLRATIPNLSYVQYTATPQGPLLISIVDLLSPKTHTVLTPGSKYTGGQTFFREIPDLVLSIPDSEVFHLKDNCLKQPPHSFKKALQLHILGVSLIVYFWNKEDFLSMMIHADRQKAASRIFHNWVGSLLETWTNFLNCSENDLGRINLEEEFEKIYNEEAIKLYKHEDNVPTFDKIKEFIPEVINDSQIALVISEADATREIDWDLSTSHILVGADMLNRGFTVENLAITYMPRHNKGKATADTIQQRCRFFGYKQNYLQSCRVFLPDESAVEYSDYVEHEEEMRNWLRNNSNLENVERQLILSDKLNVTRKNILPVNLVNAKMKGWHVMNTFQSIRENTLFVNEFLTNNTFELWEPQYGTTDRNHKYISLTIDKVIEFLTSYKFGNYPDTARKMATIRYLQYLSEKTIAPLTNAYIIQMAYDSDFRERSFDTETMKVRELFSGRSNAGESVYPGDRKIMKEDSICIQIHKIKLKCEGINKWVNKVAYTLAIYYPNALATNYVSIESKNQLEFDDSDDSDEE